MALVSEVKRNLLTQQLNDDNDTTLYSAFNPSDNFKKNWNYASYAMKTNNSNNQHDTTMCILAFYIAIIPTNNIIIMQSSINTLRDQFNIINRQRVRKGRTKSEAINYTQSYTHSWTDCVEGGASSSPHHTAPTKNNFRFISSLDLDSRIVNHSVQNLVSVTLKHRQSI